MCGDGTGGVVTFLGVVRARADDGRAVDGLHYEAFAPMAIAEFERIAAEAARQFDGAVLGIVHRTGDLTVGEVAVAVCASAAHRQAAFGACAFAIDALKRRAPIWKKEYYTDGSGTWKANAGG
ncbi:MAG: molybdenum cofactor biosynthesis protein MoaE [Candidatus Eremiobacteraeota bacterium]|nr:molybdenum cofactor biosynthesis protein MoaE [Candidatus Eremiobacteraeota bacterium]MBV8372905.1 molybdenum cofactor biosynthesis protein MoaE [Candidatus Eremiobacteraeota bacterium]